MNTNDLVYDDAVKFREECGDMLNEIQANPGVSEETLSSWMTLLNTHLADLNCLRAQATIAEQQRRDKYDELIRKLKGIVSAEVSCVKPFILFEFCV